MKISRRSMFKGGAVLAVSAVVSPLASSLPSAPVQQLVDDFDSSVPYGAVHIDTNSWAVWFFDGVEWIEVGKSPEA